MLASRQIACSFWFRNTDKEIAKSLSVVGRLLASFGFQTQRDRIDCSIAQLMKKDIKLHELNMTVA
jgi:hypothetical protein